jgi:XapX domain-containing protein
MKLYIASLAVGLLVGVLYAMLGVHSPAPPMVALVGLLGILVGEQIPHLIRQVVSTDPASVAWLDQIKPHVFGHLPTGRKRSDKSP